MILLFAWAGTDPPRGARPGDQDCIRLLVEVAAGDQSALQHLYQKTSRLVYGVALKIVGNPADAEEVTLDVYSQVWRKASDYHPERAVPTTWLVMLTRSRALDRVRSFKTRLDRESPLGVAPNAADTQQDAEQTAWIHQRREIVLHSLSELPEDQQKALQLAFYEGLSHGDIATKLNLPVGTVKARIRLGMAKLRKSLGQEGSFA